MVKRVTLHFGRMHVFLLVLALATSLRLDCQVPFQKHFSMDDGLPFSAVDQVSIARNGEVWVQYSLREYFSRFNGIYWRHYNMQKEKLPLVLSFMTEDDYGKWWQGIEQQKTYLVCFRPNEKWEKYLVPTPTKPYVESGSGSPVLVDSNCYEYRFDRGSKTVQASKQPIYSPKATEQLHAIYKTMDGQMYMVIRNPAQNKYYLRFGHGFSDTLNIQTSNPEYLICYTLKKGLHKSLLWKDGVLFWTINQKTQAIQITLPTGETGNVVSYTSLFLWSKSPENTIRPAWLVSAQDPKKRFIYQIDENGKAQLLKSQFPETAFPSLAQDVSGAWWIGSSIGMTHHNPNRLTFLEDSENMVTGVHTIHEAADGTIWMGGYNGSGGFSVYNGVQLSRKQFDAVDMSILPGTYRSSKGSLYFFMERPPGVGVIVNNQISPAPIPGQPSQIRGYFFLRLKSGKIALGLQDLGLGFTEEKNGKLSGFRTIGQKKGMELLNVITIAEDWKGRLWLGRPSQGLALYDPKRDTAVSWLRTPGTTKGIGAKCSMIDSNGTLWIGAQNGLYQLKAAHLFDYQNNDVFKHLKKFQLPGNDTSIVSFITQSDQFLIVGSDLGVYFIDKRRSGKRQRIGSLIYGRDIEGRGSRQNAVLIDSKGYLWFSANGAVSRIKISSLDFDTQATKVELSSFQAGDIKINLIDGKIGKIPLRKRNIRFTFVPKGNGYIKDELYFNVEVIRNRQDTLYRQTRVRNRDHLLSYLPPGHYKLSISTYKNNLQTGLKRYYFTIPRQLDESVWFWLLLSVLALAIPILLLLYQQRLKKQRLEQIALFERSKRMQDNLKIQTLSGFFNPHFINNTLNWIQSRYREDHETTMVIEKLADNVEALYYNTQHGLYFHSLNDELKIVDNYVKIQLVRFAYAFSVEMDIPSEYLEECIPVPALLLQIHVENAIEKGIRKREGATTLKICVRQSPQGFMVIVEDDGRGRVPSNYSDPTRKGSVVVMNELIDLLNQYNKEPILVNYEDFIYNTPKAGSHGTRVIIQLPKHFDYDFSQVANTSH